MLDRFVNNSDLAKLLLRLSVGGLMLFHGINKLQHGYGFVEKMLEKAHLPGYLSHGILVGEVLAPILIVLGLYTRFAALMQVAVMVMAIYLVHTGDMFRLTEHGAYALELQGLYLFGALALFFLGAGRYRPGKGKGVWS
ncbi:DoxX family protein [Chlorobium phaeovibrioides]|uniref:DoxX family protein n=1 Tax=Chlorobium phaeovibrioides (strain DSM 265 / 1930) TaxID=290318 RepID=A4SF59_CHLPM|nr:DoxX family protein [Chlorobium phaeovibrioides]QEQ56821.1 DoxX family protein [Chlorobium phaeovibrioides]HCD37069.1 DoxX family protein [Chlorobium sp.]